MPTPSLPARHARTGLAAVIAFAVVCSVGLAGGPPVRFLDFSAATPFLLFEIGDGNNFRGAAWFDADNDGTLDVYITNGCGNQNLLLMNRGVPFVDVASAAGVADGAGCNGVVTADIDNDGFQDIFTTGEGGFIGTCASPVHLYHHNGIDDQGNVSFTDITESSGITGPEDALSFAFGDINNDGFLDLFITAPGDEPGTQLHRNKLFLNNGDLTFTDISASSGVDTNLGACVTMFSDYDGDGLIDLFVGNCVRFATGGPIELFRNNGDLTFTDVAADAGLDTLGYWMALAPGDYDNDGDIDFFATNLAGNFVTFPHAFYRNNGDGTYTDVGEAAGVAAFEFSWGASMTDFDNDGYSDLFVVGSEPRFAIGPGSGNPGRIFFNNRNGTFTDFTAASLTVDLSSRLTSGIAVGDYNNDGFEDVLVPVSGSAAVPGSPVLFRNRKNANNWIQLKLEGALSNRDAVGARVEVHAGSLQQTKEIYAGSGFASMNAKRLTFGLAEHETTDLIRVRWPSGLVEEFPNAAANQMLTLVEGLCCGGCVISSQCEDGDPCTTAECVEGACSVSTIESPMDGDGCCPVGANADNDNDCVPVCGNAVCENSEGPVDCSADCPCAGEVECDDLDACTADECVDAACVNASIVTPTNGDGCCPSGAHSDNDTDCVPVCGNGVCESSEDFSGCSVDCQCEQNEHCNDLDSCTFDRCTATACVNATADFGDIAGASGTCGPDGIVDLFDIFAVLDGFVGSFAEGCESVNIDLVSQTCMPDGRIDLFDILAVLDAFGGVGKCCTPSQH